MRLPKPSYVSRDGMCPHYREAVRRGYWAEARFILKRVKEHRLYLRSRRTMICRNRANVFAYFDEEPAPTVEQSIEASIRAAR